MDFTNRVFLIGNVGTTPFIKALHNNKMARLMIVTNEEYRNYLNKQVEDTQWHVVLAWSPLAELVEASVTKGSHVAIQGKLRTRVYVDPENRHRSVTEIYATDILVLK